MSPSRAELVDLFDRLSDEELEQRAGNDILTPLAQEVAEEELGRRGIALPAGPPDVPEPVRPAVEGELGFVVLARYLDPMDAQTLRARLEAESIPAMLPDGNYNQALGLIGTVLGGTRVLVAEEYAKEARRLLADMNAGSLALDPAAEPEPSPGQDALLSTDRRRFREIAAAAFVMILAILGLLLQLGQAVVAHDVRHGWSGVPLWPFVLPTLYFVAAVLFWKRSKWSLAWFALYVFASLAVNFSLAVYAGNPYFLGNGLIALATTGLILCYGIHLLGQGRLR